MSTLVIPARFHGPPRSGNGGWTAGALAAATGLRGPIQVTLRMPPPLDTALPIRWHEDRLVAEHDERVVVEAQPGGTPARLPPVPPVTPEAALAAEASYAGLRHHPFPTCFSCGVDRVPGDGLRIFPGPVGPRRSAATWTPQPSHGDRDTAWVPITWAALDCVGAWASDLEHRPLVLGRITATVDTLPTIGDRHVVVGEVRAEEGRRTHTASALYDASGRLLAQAEHIWFAIDPADFQ